MPIFNFFNIKKLYFCFVMFCYGFLNAQNLSDITFGSNNTLDIITWNLEQFAKNDQVTIDSLTTVINSLDPDVIGVQEISNTQEFNTLINSLSGYSGYYSSTALRLGFIYKTSLSVDSISTIYSNNTYNFAGRAPIMINFHFNGEAFHVINVHLKCCGDGTLDINDSSDEETRRYNALNMLKTYVDQNLPQSNVLIIGDYNDVLTDSYNNNVFNQFINDSLNYRFEDFDIATGPSYNWSFPNWPSHLDHILISNEIFDENTSVLTIPVDDYLLGGFSQYDAIISDHLPVGISVDFSTLSFGCTDSTANNYDPTAFYDNGSCIYTSTSNLFISEIADPNNNSAGRFIEITNSANYDIDLNGYELQRWTNGNSYPSTSTNIDLIGVIPSGGSHVIAKSNDFYLIYGFNPSQIEGSGGPVDSNGDDQIALLFNGQIIDMFGVVGEDGTGTLHEFEDGRAKRKCFVTAPNPTWNYTEWDIDNDNGLGNGPQNAPVDFNPFYHCLQGCTDSTALNYNSNANVDDGTCINCLQNGLIFNIGGGSNDFEISWSLSQFNGWASASGSAGTSFGCVQDDCYLFNMYDSGGDGWNGATYSILDSLGNLIASGGFSGNGFFNIDTIQIGNLNPCNVYGCTNDLSCNYNPLATIDDGTCDNFHNSNIDMTLGLWSFEYCEHNSTPFWGDCGCVIEDGFIFDDNSFEILLNGTVVGNWSLCNNNLNFYFLNSFYMPGYGSLVNSGTNFLGMCSQGCCSSWILSNPVLGCTDISANNYNSSANFNDSSCYYLGCTDPNSIDYDPTATLDDGSCNYLGCTDPAADNYDVTATVDDGSCTYSNPCPEAPITGLFIDGIIDDRVNANFDNMNTYDANGNQVCRVDQIRIQYRPVGTSAWSAKNIASPVGYDPNTGICNSTQATMKPVRNLTLATTYEWRVKVWYCSGGNGGWVDGVNFTTAPECPNVANFTAYGATTTKATFYWDASNGVYDFVRIKLRVDSLSNPTGSDWTLAGGFGVPYGTNTKNKNGLAPGETYRGQARTWCDPNGGAYNSLSWTPIVTWIQPTVRLEGGTAINNLDVYPNPSRDVFNVVFNSETIQDIRIRVLNIVGEEIMNEDLQRFVGEYTKKINLKDNAKGIYFLEINTSNSFVNKKLILQ